MQRVKPDTAQSAMYFFELMELLLILYSYYMLCTHVVVYLPDAANYKYFNLIEDTCIYKAHGI